MFSLDHVAKLVEADPIEALKILGKIIDFLIAHPELVTLLVGKFVK